MVYLFTSARQCFLLFSVTSIPYINVSWLDGSDVTDCLVFLGICPDCLVCVLFDLDMFLEVNTSGISIIRRTKNLSDQNQDEDTHCHGQE